MATGADLWHMNNYAGQSMALKVRRCAQHLPCRAAYNKVMRGGMIVVGPDGKHFTDEKFKARHGKVPVNGRWLPPPTPCPMFIIFDETLFRADPLYDKHPSHGWTQVVERYDGSEDNSAELANGRISKADSLADLTASTGLDGQSLAGIVARWNRFCTAGEDADFGRTLMLAPIVASSFYAVELSPSMLNTQGGPRRNDAGRSFGRTARRSPACTAPVNSGRSTATCIRAPETLASAWTFGRVSGRNAAVEAPWG